MVFDSRSPQVAHGGLTQEFVGQTIEVKKPLFNSGIVTLMDFRCDQSQGFTSFISYLFHPRMHL